MQINQNRSLQIGMYVLCVQEKLEEYGLLPIFGIRVSKQNGGMVLAVPSDENLEFWDFERIGEMDLVTTEHTSREYMIRGEFPELAENFFVQGFSEIGQNSLPDHFQPGFLGAWRSESDPKLLLLSYESGYYDGGIREDKATFGSSLYVIACVNAGALMNSDSQNRTSASSSEVTEQSVHFAQLYLLWIDNGDNDMPVDPQIRSRYTELAMKHPSCSIEEEASSWMKIKVRSMSEDEIEKAIAYAIDLCKGRWTPDWMDAHEDNLRGYLRLKRNEG